MTLANMAKTIIPHGTTTIACDPHEIGNVFGIEGVKYIAETGANTPLNTQVLVPSCIPSAEGLETSGAMFNSKEIIELLTLENVVGLGEVMDYPGVINDSKRMREILEVARKKNIFIQGHAPSLVNRRLSAYLSQGIESCHETSFAEEAKYKLRAGMTLECRESSIVQDIKTLAPIIKQFNYPETLTFCTDDREPDDLARQGHLDHVIRQAIKEGIPAIEAIKIATYNAARLLRLNNIGSLTAGKKADIVLLNDLNEFIVNDVFIAGKQYVKDQKLILAINNPPHELEQRNSVILKNGLSKEDFKIAATTKEAQVNLITYQKDMHIVTVLKQETLPTKDGYLDLSERDDLCTIAILERHGVNGNKGQAIIKDFGLLKGAIASTLGHDCHNLTVLGKNVDDMYLAAQTLKEIKGGMVIVHEQKIMALLELPVAGLISLEPVETLSKKVKNFKTVLNEFGITSPSPIIQIAAFALPVIPYVRITDRGLVDVDQQKLIPLILNN